MRIAKYSCSAWGRPSSRKWNLYTSSQGPVCSMKYRSLVPKLLLTGPGDNKRSCSLSLPNGGGAIRVIGKKFTVNPTFVRKPTYTPAGKLFVYARSSDLVTLLSIYWSFCCSWIKIKKDEITTVDLTDNQDMCSWCIHSPSCWRGFSLLLHDSIFLARTSSVELISPAPSPSPLSVLQQ